MFRSLRPRPAPIKPDFSLVVDQELPVLYRVAQRLTRDDTRAEDLVGQTLYLAARAWPTFDGEFPRSWLIRILRNEYALTIRKSVARPETAIDEVVEPSDEGFWREIDWRLVGQEVLRVLDALPEDFRLVIALCDVEGMSRDEAAEALDLPTGTVNSRLSRGRNLLRAQLVRVLGELAPQGI